MGRSLRKKMTQDNGWLSLGNILQGLLVILLGAGIVGLFTMSNTLTAMNARLAAVEGATAGYAAMSNRTTALETITSEHSRRIGANERKIENSEERMRSLEREHGKRGLSQ